jgi:glutathione S-transferase
MRNLLWEKTMKQALGQGAPEAAALRAGYAALKHHLEYIGWLAENRKFLAGANLSLADFAAASMLSSLDFIGDVDWSVSAAAKEWYARIKSRPSFRAILADRMTGMAPPPHYADLDF